MIWLLNKYEQVVTNHYQVPFWLLRECQVQASCQAELPENSNYP